MKTQLSSLTNAQVRAVIRKLTRFEFTGTPWCVEVIFRSRSTRRRSNPTAMYRVIYWGDATGPHGDGSLSPDHTVQVAAEAISQCQRGMREDGVGTLISMVTHVGDFAPRAILRGILTPGMVSVTKSKGTEGGPQTSPA